MRGEMKLHFDPKQFELVQTTKQLAAWSRRCKAAKSVCVDTETTGLDVMTADLVGAALAVCDEESGMIEACYIPVAHSKKAMDGGRFKNMSWPVAREMLRPILEDPKKPKTLHNAGYDLAICERHGLRLQNVHCSMAMAYTLLGRSEFSLGMDHLAKKFLRYDTIHYEDVVVPALGHETFADVRCDHACTYSAEDTAVSLMLAKVLQSLLKKDGLWDVYNLIDRPLLPVLHEMKMTGALVDTARLDQLKVQWDRAAAKAEKRAHRIVGRQFNLASPKDLSALLYDELGLPCSTFTKSGGKSTAGNALDYLDHPVVEAISEWRKFTKLVSTYCVSLKDKKHPVTGRVHTSFNSTFTNTRRFSSSEPNLQNIPTRTEEGAEIRGAFIAGPGNVIVCSDKSQIEYRILAHITQAPALVNAFKNGQDLHATMAALVRGGDWREYADKKKDPAKYKVRSTFKNVNFATIYGAGPRKVAAMSDITEAEAYDLLDAHRELAPEVYEWKDDVIEFCREHGYVETIFGARVYVPNIRSKDTAKKSRAERQAVNAVIQGSAADCMRLAMGNVRERLHSTGLYAKGARLLITCHDELVAECPKKLGDAVARELKEGMETFADGWIEWNVPLVSNVDMGGSWKDAK